jgi:acetaldehyde dehydrogenase/alcohol dehydrogenase
MDIFDIQTKVVLGEGSLEKMKDLGVHDACIICDPFMVSSGKINELLTVLREANIKYRVFSDIVPDPSIEVVVQGIIRILNHKPDAVIAFGGGSAIDTAKIVSYFYTAIQGVEKPLGIAIPTTSGTGSEVTSFAVISDKAKQVKYPLHDKTLIPDVAILEPELIRTVPPSVTADTGMDVLTHALEAFVSTGACDFSDAFSEKAMRYVFRYLPIVYKNPNDMIAREKIHNASCMAGMAFNHAGLGVNHSMAHALGAVFHIPHGKANAILLPYVSEYNAGLVFSKLECNKAAVRYAYLSEILGMPASTTAEGVESLISAMIHLMKTVEIPLNLKDYNIPENTFAENLNALCEAAFHDRCTSANPVKITIDEIREIYIRCYTGTRTIAK